MVFSIDTAKNIIDKQTTINKARSFMIESFENKSFFNESLDMILEESKVFAASMSQINAVNEGLLGRVIGDGIYNAGKRAAKDMSHNIGWTNILSGIFDWFVQSIINLGRSFLINLMAFLNKDALVKKNQEKLAHFAGPIKYSKPMYNFQNLGIFDKDNTSYTDYKTDMSDIVDSVFNRLGDLEDCTTEEDLYRFIDSVNEEMEDKDEALGLIRGKLVGYLNEVVTPEEYADELFVYFHGSDTISEPDVGFFDPPNIDKARIQEAYKGYFGYKTQKAEVEKFMYNCKAEANSDKMKLRKLELSRFVSSSVLHSPSAMIAFNSIISAKCKIIQDISQIYLQFFSAKLDAMKEYTILNRNILFECLRYMKKKGM